MTATAEMSTLCRKTFIVDQQPWILEGKGVDLCLKIGAGALWFVIIGEFDACVNIEGCLTCLNVMLWVSAHSELHRRHPLDGQPHRGIGQPGQFPLCALQAYREPADRVCRWHESALDHFGLSPWLRHHRRCGQVWKHHSGMFSVQKFTFPWKGSRRFLTKGRMSMTKSGLACVYCV